MKKIVLILSLLVFGFVSCKTTSPVYSTITASGGQLKFLRPFSVKTSNKEIKDLNLDITVQSQVGGILVDPTLNYTFEKELKSTLNTDKIVVGLSDGENEILPKTKSIMFKESDDGKMLKIRYTTTVDKTLFEDMLMSGKPMYVLVIYEDGTRDLLPSEEFDEKLFNLKMSL